MKLSTVDAAGIAAAVDSARTSGQTQWVALVVDVAAVDLLRCYALCGLEDRFLWERRGADERRGTGPLRGEGPRPEAGERFVAWGRVDEIESAGSERFQDVEAWAASVASRLHWLGLERSSGAPLCVGGFGFDDDGSPDSKWKAFPAARFVLPEAIVASRDADDGTSGLTLLTRVEPGMDCEEVARALSVSFERAERFARAPLASASAREGVDLAAHAICDWPQGPEYRVRSDRAHAVFEAQVAQALDAIEAGSLDKVVLARSLRVDHDGRLDIPGFLERLRTLYPSCTLVAMGRGDDTFLAATPETLVRVEGDRVATAALAGSAPRGRTPQEDVELGSALEASEKERAEHAHVVEALREVLGRNCDRLEIPDRPALRKLVGIQHLETPISGRLAPRSDAAAKGRRSNPVLELVDALHPTPAVGGVPASRARDWLRRNEGLDRGWYASPVGWLDAEGGGGFCVALRSALIEGNHAEPDGGAGSRAWLFAGAGIVAGSQPAEELAETRIKLRALLAPLTEI